MKRGLSVLCLAALTGILPASGQTPPAAGPEPQRMVRQMRPPPPAMTGDRADIAVELVRGMPVIAAMVNGRGPYRFGVDTGAAGYLRVSPALAEQLALQQVGEALAGDPSGRNPTRIPVYRVDSLGFGGLTYRGVSTTPLGLAGTRGLPIDGIVGIGFFEQLLLTIDYGRMRLVAAPGTLPPADGRDIVDAAIDRGTLTIPITIGGVRQLVHLDTGNTVRALSVPAAAVAGLPTSGTPREAGRARTVSQEIVLSAQTLSAPVMAGTTRLPVTEVSWPAAAPPGNIGSLALQGMALTIDHANRRVRIVPSAPR